MSAMVESGHVVCHITSMILLVSLIVAARLSQPAEPLAGQLRAAVWQDLQVNALIGNGNLLASDWYNAGSDTDPDLHIRDLRCDSRNSVKQCSFRLIRDGVGGEVNRQQVPDKLACDAIFTRGSDENGWGVKHTPLHRIGHSQTTMHCTAERA